MDDEPMWAADRVVAPTPGSAITILETANEFAIIGNHLTFVKENQFDGRIKTDPHKHIHEFTENEAVRLMMFPFLLTDLFDRLLGEIRAFSPHETETLTEAWLLMKEMLRNCHGYNLSKGNIIKFFYHGLSEITQVVLNAAAGGSSNSDTEKIMVRMDAMTMKMDALYKEFQSRSNLSKNMLVEVDKSTFLVDFVILEMEEDSKVPLILGRPFLYTADALIRAKQKQLNLGVDFDAILDEGSEILHSIEGTILEEKLFAEFDEFMAMNIKGNSESESDIEEPPIEKITFSIDYKIMMSLEEPTSDLELKPLPNNLEYVFLEEPSFFLCMLGIFHDMIEESMEVFMDDFSIFGNSFDNCLNNLDKMLQRCKDANLVLNYEKCHFIVKEGIVLGHKVSGACLKVEKAKIGYREYDLAHLKLVFEFSIYTVWKSVRYGVSNGLDTAYWSFLEHGYVITSLRDMTYSEDYGILLGIIVNRLKSGSYRVKSGRHIDLDLFKLAIVLQKTKKIQDFGPTSGIRASRGTLMMMKHHSMQMHQTMKEEYDIWAMEMEHYLEYIDNDVWKVIQNGNSKKRISTGKDGVIRVLPPVSAAEIHAVEKERKARNMVLLEYFHLEEISAAERKDGVIRVLPP
ncbi:reverse transcriptase domain-containing protein [Tanacetum coccineum]|uniref:Reverse transcriptase domain-containing protein n=1 Tax=Tanacetum coccineum TaxID=301880 RepID=A0ABQ5D6M0_9ASTR